MQGVLAWEIQTLYDRNGFPVPQDAFDLRWKTERLHTELIREFTHQHVDVDLMKYLHVISPCDLYFLSTWCLSSKGMCSKKKRWRPGYFYWPRFRSQARSLLPHQVGWDSYSGLARFKDKKWRFCLSFLEECQYHFVRRICGINIYLSCLLTALSGVVWNLHTQERCLRYNEETIESFWHIGCIQ